MKHKKLEEVNVQDFVRVQVDGRDDEYTIFFTMKDGGYGLVDIYFFNDGDGMEVMPEIYKDTVQTEAFVDLLNASVGVGDWMEQIKKGAGMNSVAMTPMDEVAHFPSGEIRELEDHIKSAISVMGIPRHMIDGGTEQGEEQCLYCEKKESTHFRCEVCGDGMCDECYEEDVEHDNHYNNIMEVVDLDEVGTKIMKELLGDDPAYVCETCANNALKKVRTLLRKIRKGEAGEQ